MTPAPASAYTSTDDFTFQASELTRGPWSAEHQHAGPPSALVCRAIERAAAPRGLTHLGRLTVNLLRPVPIGALTIDVREDYGGRNAAHFSARLVADGKDIALFTALMQREDDVPVPAGTAGHPLPAPPRSPEASVAATMPFGRRHIGYGNLVETRVAAGKFFDGPCAAWFRLRYPLLNDETPSPYQCVAVAADSGNGISAALDFARYSFVNCDLTINLLRRPVGTWICLDARTELGGNGCGVAASVLYDETGLIGRATQSLAVRPRAPAPPAAT
ncbi:MAG TPA: thioesterase family protein [Burkholderiaceae bacterium]|nr:thioesterase family protein [Burkholderiaceae bacterium]